IESEDARLARFRAKMAKRDIERRKREKTKYVVNTILLFVVLAVLIPVGIYYASIEKKDKITFVLKNQANCNTPAGPDIKWDNCQIQGIKLDKLNLSGSSFRTANMIGASLWQANLFEADISYANLSGAMLREVKLENAIAKGTSLRSAVLIGANLKNADFSYADLSGADLSEADLTNTRFDHAIWVNRVVCAKGSIGGCIPK
ncbi:MAG: pentapeptide repeat-containing protein, partial [Gammaproteobacteria bacterium]|nr:pentapeptide repeat-containing protein [Gammaproteobacteria bacterium]